MNSTAIVAASIIARNALRAEARGVYQQGLALGCHRWSGGDLAGKAAKFSGHYARSRANLLARASKRCGLRVTTTLAVVDGRQRRVLAVVLGGKAVAL